MSLRVYLVDIVPHNLDDRELQQRLLELENLTKTYGGIVIVKTIQRKDKPNYKTFIGSGKLDEIIGDMIATQSDVLILGNMLKPAQIFTINELMRRHPLVKEMDSQLQVWDKIDLILKIFAKHAKSVEAKLQIELAAIRHMGPRIYGMGMELSKQGGSSSGGGGATRGLGETNTERMRRHLAKQAQDIEKKLKKYENMRDMHRIYRERRGFISFGIVGYTNAGKSSLLQAMSKKDIYIANELFATLGTEVGKVYLAPIEPLTPPPHRMGETSTISPRDTIEKQKSYSLLGKEVLLIDTIGFIRDLPPQLIKAFASTLEDSIQSDILLHVIDASDPDIVTKVEVVEAILEEIGANQDVIYVFNKSDMIDDRSKNDIADQRYGERIVFVSALSGAGLDDLRQAMWQHLESLN